MLFEWKWHYMPSQRNHWLFYTWRQNLKLHNHHLSPQEFMLKNNTLLILECGHFIQNMPGFNIWLRSSHRKQAVVWGNPACYIFIQTVYPKGHILRNRTFSQEKNTPDNEKSQRKLVLSSISVYEFQIQKYGFKLLKHYLLNQSYNKPNAPVCSR